MISWPVDTASITKIGESVMRHRAGSGRPHRGIDIFVPKWTEVKASESGRVIRVVDGRFSQKDSRKRAGLWIDIEDVSGQLYRYLHLGEAYVGAGAVVKQGDLLAAVAPPHTSGLGKDVHIHFEIREKSRDGEYGKPINPLQVLPKFQLVA